MGAAKAIKRMLKTRDLKGEYICNSSSLTFFMRKSDRAAGAPRSSLKNHDETSSITEPYDVATA